MRNKKAVVFMMDLVATVPYYTAYLSRALLAANVPLRVGSISYYLDPGCFKTRHIQLDPGLLDLAGKFALPPIVRRPLKLIETIANMAALAVRFLFNPPSIVHVQYLPMLQWWLPLDSWLVSFCRMRGAKSVLTVHDLLPHDSADKYKQVFTRLYRSVDGLICHSGHIRTRLILEFGVSGEKVWVIPHGPLFFDLPNHPGLATTQLLQAKPHELIVLWQGIIFTYKGLDVLLDAWRQVEAQAASARLIVVGTGTPDMLDRVRNQAATLGLSRVTLLLHFASTQQLISIYRAAHIVVYPYRAITTSGALATGMALGKAIIASDLPVFRELLSHGADALLVEPADPQKLSEAIVSLLENEPMRESLASALASRQYGDRCWAAIAQQTRQVYTSLLEDL